MARQARFFDVEERYVQLSSAGDPLEALASSVAFEVWEKGLLPFRGRVTYCDVTAAHN